MTDVAMNSKPKQVKACRKDLNNRPAKGYKLLVNSQYLLQRSEGSYMSLAIGLSILSYPNLMKLLIVINQL